MKVKIVTIAVILPILIALGIVCMVHTQSLVEQYAQAIRDIEEQARDGDMAGAQQTLTEIATRWEKKMPILQLWVCHSDTDEVTRRLKGLQVGLVIEDEPLIFEHSAALIEALNHLHHCDDLTLSNIL